MLPKSKIVYAGCAVCTLYLYLVPKQLNSQALLPGCLGGIARYNGNMQCYIPTIVGVHRLQAPVIAPHAQHNVEFK